jgi:hypothetical protein
MTSQLKMDIKGPSPIIQLSRGKDFARSWKQFLDKIAQFGDNGQELFDEVPRRPILPLKYNTINSDGTWQSDYNLRSDQMGLSDAGALDFNFDRNQAATAISTWNKNAGKLLQLLLDHLSEESKAILELKNDELTGYHALRSRVDNLGLAKMIKESHLGSSTRSKQVSFQEFLQWRQKQADLSDFPMDLAAYRTLLETVKLNFESAAHPGFFPFEALARIVFVMGLDHVKFQREIENSYDQNIMKTTAELMEICQNSAMERGLNGRTEFVPTTSALVTASDAALATVTSGKKPARPSLGRYPTGGSKETTCPYCWSKGYPSTNHGADHPTKKDCFFQLRSEASKAKQAKSSTAPMSSAAAHAFVSRYTTDGYQEYVAACKIAGIACPELESIPTILLASATAIVVEDDDNRENYHSKNKISFQKMIDGKEIENYTLVTDGITPRNTVFYFDSCASIHLTHDLDLLLNATPLDPPLKIGGIGSGVSMTHVGVLHYLSAYPNVSKTYYSPQATHNLLSMGLLQRHGFSYATSSPSHTVIRDPNGIIFDQAVVQPNNLLQSSFDPSTLVVNYACAASYLSAVEQYRRHMKYACVMSYEERLQRVTTSHYTAEQRERCERVEAFHQGRGVHFSDDVFAEALHNGLHAELNLTPQDVRNNRRLRGPCPNCTAAKFKQQPMPTSQTEPASMVAQHLHIDIHEKTKKSPGGKLVAIRCSDDFSGDLQYESAISKNAEHLFDAIVALIHRRYTVHGHRVYIITADADPALEPLIPLFQSRMQIVLSLVSPGMHEHFIENRTGSQAGKIRAVVNSMEQQLPSQYDCYAEKWVMDNSNGMPNSRSRPSTADILVTGHSRVVHPNTAVRFGVTALVSQSLQKRVSVANAESTTPKMVNPAELGMCLGYCNNVPGDYLFLLDNGKIVPRRNIKVINAVFTLFGEALPLRNVLRTPLLPSSPHPVILQPEPPLNGPLYESYDHSVSASPYQGIMAPPAEVPLPSVPLMEIATPVRQTTHESSFPATFDVRALVDSHGQSIHHASSGPTVATSPVKSIVPTSLSQDSSPERPATSPVKVPVIVRRSARLQKEQAALVMHGSSRQRLPDKDGFILVGRLPFPAPPFSPPICIVRTSRGPTHTSEPITVSSVSHIQIVKRPRRTITKVVTRASKVAARCRDKEDSNAIDKAIIQSRQEFLALVATATETLPFTLGKDEYVFDDNNLPPFVDDDDAAPHQDAALMSSYDKMPADELKPVKDHVARQLSLSLALRTHSSEKLERVITAEIEKLIKIGGLHNEFYPTRADLPVTVDDTQILNGIFVFKDKSDGRETARLAANGSRCPLPPGQISFAEVVPTDDKHMTMAGAVGYFNSRDETMNHSSCDVVGAFPRVARPPGSIEIYLRLPHNLPHKWAGGYVRIKGAIYGLKESSRLFQLELVKVIQSAGYRSMPESHMTFQAVDNANKGLMSIASVVVDDVLSLDNCKTLTTRLQQAIKTRFHEITIDDGRLFAGIEYDFFVTDVQTPRNSVFAHQNKYINRIARNEGIVHMPPVTSLDMQDFFEASTSADDLVPSDSEVYQRILGCCVHTLQTRADLRPYVSYLSGHNIAPNAGDMSKAIYLLRYLYSTQAVGLVFNACTTQICAYSDSAFAVHEHGQSSTGLILCMGPTDAPFVCSAKKQSSVAPDVVASEYYAAGEACLLISHYRQLATSLGWLQGPTKLFMDSQSAINLAQAPIVPKKSRHMHARFHYIREAVETKEIELVHILSHQMRVDVITKIMTTSKFCHGRDMLMNQHLAGFIKGNIDG